MFYNRSGHEPCGGGDVHSPPLPPDRNTINGRSKPRAGVSRGESTASRRPLLAGESFDERASERRSHIYNPLQREKSSRQSGPYDHLANTKARDSGDPEEPPETPHDYFTLEKKNRDSLEGEVEGNTDTLTVEDEIDHMDTIDEDETEGAETPKVHDYFVLEPHQKVNDKGEASNKKPSSVKSSKSPTKSVKSNGSAKDGPSKPEAKPRVTKQQSAQSPTGSSDDSEHKETGSTSEQKMGDEVYVLSKLGDAPTPPMASMNSSGGDSSTVSNDNEYLSPKEVQNKPDYVDVLPAPPERTSSLEHQESPMKLSDSHHKKLNSPTKGRMSPVKSMNSPNHSPVRKQSSPVKNKGSPKKISSNQSSPSKTPSPEKRMESSEPAKAPTVTDV